MPKITLQEMLKTCMAQVIAAYEQLTEENQIKVGIQTDLWLGFGRFV